MSVKLYDDALLDKFKKWCEGIDLTILSPDETAHLLQVKAQQTDDSPIELPLICITRPAGYELSDNPHKHPITFDGYTLQANSKKSIQLNAIPIKLSYQLHIMTRYREEADDLARNFIFNLINYPRFSIYVPYNDVDYEQEAMIKVQSEIADNSNIDLRLVTGQFTRLTITFDIEGAYLWDARIRPTLGIECLDIEEI